VRKVQRKVKIRRALGDGATTLMTTSSFLATCGIEAGIKVRGNSNPNCGGAREEAMRACLKNPLGWKERVGYGQRWMAETLFSGFKWLFDEVVSAKQFERMVKEVELNVWVYNLSCAWPRLSPPWREATRALTK